MSEEIDEANAGYRHRLQQQSQAHYVLKVTALSQREYIPYHYPERG